MRTLQDATESRNNFDFLRFVAAAGVILSHSYPVTEGSNKRELLHALSGGQMTIGEVCVAVFFIISGFLITQSFFRSGSLIEYFGNRILRIVPGLAMVTLLTCLVVGPLVSSVAPRDYWSNYLTFRYLGNILIYSAVQRLPGVFEGNIYPVVTNASIWTLSYEFTCYILVAAVGFAIRRSWLLALGILAVASGTIFLTYISPRIFLVFSGYFLAGAVAYAARRFIVLDFRLFFLSVFVLCLAILLGAGLIASMCIFGAYATFFLAFFSRLPAQNFASNGDLSYGVYLYAWPVQQILSPYTPSPFVNFLVSFPIILICALFSWKIVERPALSKKKVVAHFVKQKIGLLASRLV